MVRRALIHGEYEAFPGGKILTEYAWDGAAKCITGAARFRWSAAERPSAAVAAAVAHPGALTTASDNSFGSVVRWTEGDGPQFTAWLESVYHRPCPLETTVRVTTEHQRTERDAWASSRPWRTQGLHAERGPRP